MTGEPGSTCYYLREPFECAVASLRRSLASRGLRVVGQLDVSRRVQTSLGLGLPPCRLILVMPDLITTAGMHSWAAVLLPLHIVVSGCGVRTSIHVQNRIPAAHQTDGAELAVPIGQTQQKVSRAIEAIAMRSSILG